MQCEIRRQIPASYYTHLMAYCGYCTRSEDANTPSRMYNQVIVNLVAQKLQGDVEFESHSCVTVLCHAFCITKHQRMQSPEVRRYSCHHVSNSVLQSRLKCSTISFLSLLRELLTIPRTKLFDFDMDDDNCQYLGTGFIPPNSATGTQKIGIQREMLAFLVTQVRALVACCTVISVQWNLCQRSPELRGRLA